MGLIEWLLSFLDKNMSAILLWFYNKEVDDRIKAETETKVIKEEAEILSKEEKLKEVEKESTDKVLNFKKKLAEYRKEEGHNE